MLSTRAVWPLVVVAALALAACGPGEVDGCADALACVGGGVQSVGGGVQNAAGGTQSAGGGVESAGGGVQSAGGGVQAASGGGQELDAGTATKPSIPTGLVATAGDGLVTLTWNSIPPAEQVERYQVYRDGTLITDGPITPQSVAMGLTNGHAYAFRVSALNAAGYSDWTAAQTATPMAVATTTPELPNLSAIANNGSQAYDQAFIDLYKHIDLVMIGGNAENWGTSTRKRETIVTGVKAGDGTVHPRVVQYGIIDSVDPTNAFGNSPINSPVLWNKVMAENWYLWSAGSSGTHTKNFYNAAFYALNSTEYVGSDASGHKLEDWFATYQVDQYKSGMTNNAAPSMDGFFHDNVQAAPYAPVSGPDGDWNRNGTADLHNSPTTGQWYRTGLARWASQMRISNPGGLVMANADWSELLSDNTRPFLVGPRPSLRSRACSMRRCSREHSANRTPRPRGRRRPELQRTTLPSCSCTNFTKTRCCSRSTG